VDQFTSNQDQNDLRPNPYIHIVRYISPAKMLRVGNNL